MMMGQQRPQMLKSKKRYRKALLLQAAEQGKAGEDTVGSS